MTQPTPPNQIGDAPIESMQEQVMRMLAALIDNMLNDTNADSPDREWGFLLMVFPFGATPGRCNYVSTAERDDVVALMKEQLKYFEAQGK